MAPSQTGDELALRCSPFHAATGTDPVGTAGCYDAFLVVELRRPWDHDVSTMWPFAELGASGPCLVAGDGRTWRPMAIDPSGDPDGLVGVEVWERSSTTDGDDIVTGPYRHRSWRVAPDELVALGGSLLAGEPLAGRSGPAAATASDSDASPGANALLVCTHGGRDVCCGSLGTSLAKELEASIPVRRCSHTGGHRFAPTAITFPDGYGWAHLDAAAAHRVADRSGPIDAVIGHCRGSSLFAAGPAQVADRAVFGAVGWAWAEATRRVVVPDGPPPAVPGDPAVEVVVTGRLADGSEVGHAVTVDVADLVPTPDCGVAAGDGTATAPVWRVVDLRSV